MLIINPGTGPVADATAEQAAENIRAFVVDVAAGIGCPNADIVPSLMSATPKGGRFTFRLRRGESRCEIDMPGIPTERVRYMGPPQNIWDFPRLYVNGSSWVWCYAIGRACEALSAKKSEDE